MESCEICWRTQIAHLIKQVVGYSFRAFCRRKFVILKSFIFYQWDIATETKLSEATGAAAPRADSKERGCIYHTPNAVNVN
jgi:hypothetical protein